MAAPQPSAVATDVFGDSPVPSITWSSHHVFREVRWAAKGAGVAPTFSGVPGFHSGRWWCPHQRLDAGRTVCKQQGGLRRPDSGIASGRVPVNRKSCGRYVLACPHLTKSRPSGRFQRVSSLAPSGAVWSKNGNCQGARRISPPRLQVAQQHLQSVVCARGATRQIGRAQDSGRETRTSTLPSYANGRVWLDHFCGVTVWASPPHVAGLRAAL